MYYILTTGLRNPCQTDASLSSYSWGSEKEVSKYNLSIGVEQSERVLSSNLLGTQTRGSTYRPSQG